MSKSPHRPFMYDGKSRVTSKDYRDKMGDIEWLKRDEESGEWIHCKTCKFNGADKCKKCVKYKLWEIEGE